MRLVRTVLYNATSQYAKILGTAVILLTLSSGGAALDLNDTESLDYYPSNQLEFRVDPDGTIQSRGDIELRGNNIDTSGGTITLRDSTNNQDILNAQEGGNVGIPNGELDVGSGAGRTVIKPLGLGGEIAHPGGGNGNFNIETPGATGSGDSVVINAPGQQIANFEASGNVTLPNGNLNVSGNNITDIDTLIFEEGTSIDGDVSIDGSLDTSGDVNLNNNNLLDANRLEVSRIVDPGDGTITTNDSLDLESDGDIDNVNKVDVGTLTSNNGNNDIQFNQGFTVDGSSGGDGGVTLSGSGGLDIDAAGGDNQQNSGDALRLDGNVNFDGGSTSPAIRTPGAGSGSIRIYDDAGAQDIAEFQEGGNVSIPNGNLSVEGTVTSEADIGFVLSGGGSDESTEIVTRSSGDSFIRVFQNNNQQDARLGLTDSSDTVVDLQARDGTIGPQNANLRLNSGYGIENGAGTKAINVDSNANVEVPSGNLDLRGNLLTNIGGTTDAGSGAIRLANGASIRARTSGNNGDVLISDVDSNNDLTVGNENVGTLSLDGGGSNLNIRDSPAVDLNGANLIEVGGSTDASTGAIRLANQEDINFRSSEDDADFGIAGTPAETIDFRDTSDNDIVRMKDGGNVELPNGRLRVPDDGATSRFGSFGNSNNIPLEVSSGGSTAGIRFQTDSQGSEKIRYSVNGKFDVTDGLAVRGDIDARGNRFVDTTSSDTVYVGDADSNTVRVDAGGSGDAVVSSGDGGSGSTERLRVTSSSGEADVDVSNSDVDLQGNSVTSSSGEVCIGDQCA